MALFNKGMRKLKGDSASHGASMNGPSITGPLMTKGVRRGITYTARKKKRNPSGINRSSGFGWRKKATLHDITERKSQGNA